MSLSSLICHLRVLARSGLRTALSVPTTMSFGEAEKIRITFDEDTVQRMKTLCQLSSLPETPPITTSMPWSLGIDLLYLRQLKDQLVEKWSWDELEKKINRFDNFLVQYQNGQDSLVVHFIHVKSPRSNAVPLMLLHGWPGMITEKYNIRYMC